jgi:glycosyltransferase involved in cell wall biosynthesis
MKVLFLAGGTPHYYNLFLNRLNRHENIEIVMVAPPIGGGKTVGSGVHQTEEDIEFKLYHEIEYKTYYGKMFFRNIGKIIEIEKPNIIISNWPYQLAWVFYPFLYLKIRLKKIKLISKEIPFQVPYYNDAISFYAKGGGINENSNKIQNQNSLFSKIKYWFIAFTRKLMVNIMDAHINYFDEAIEIHKSYGVRPEKVFITANSPDTDTIFQIKKEINFNNKLLPNNPYRLIHVGRLVRWKRVDLIINAVNILKKEFPEIELIIIGEGPEEENLQKQSLKLGLNNNVKFIGGIYKMEILGKYLSESSIYVLAGMGGLSINEAMCFGLPVICSIADGTEKRLVFEDKNGHYFQNGDLNSLANTIKKMLKNLEKTKKMGNESLRIIEEEVNIGIVQNKYLEAFNFVLKN